MSFDIVGSLRGAERLRRQRKFRPGGRRTKHRPNAPSVEITAFEGQRPGGRGWAESPAARYSFETSRLKALLNVGEAPVWTITSSAVRCPLGVVSTATTHHCRYDGSFVKSTDWAPAGATVVSEFGMPDLTLIVAAVADGSTTMNGPSVSAGHELHGDDPGPGR